LLLSDSPFLTKGTLKNLWLCEMTGLFSEVRVGLLPSYRCLIYVYRFKKKIYSLFVIPSFAVRC
jgi:hypothetical protein